MVQNQPPTSNQVIQVVIHRMLLELDFLWPYLEQHCAKYVAAQHDKDEEISRTHVHISIVDLNVTKQSLTKFLNKNDISGSDNFGILTVTQKGKKPYREDLLDEYILKGNKDMVIKYYNTTPEYIQERLSAWIEPGKLHPGKKEKNEDLTEWESIKQDAMADLGDMTNISLNDVRKWAMRWYWKRSGRLPHSTSYKRNASSIYYMLTLKFEPVRCESTALDEIMEFNY
jgi:hypothetical protein